MRRSKRLLFWTIAGTVWNNQYFENYPLGYEGKDAIITAYADSDMIDGLCYNEYPYSIILPETKALGKLLMLLPLFSAVVARLMMFGAWRRYGKESNKEEEALEARSLFIGFVGKIIFKGTMMGVHHSDDHQIW